jgi:outer membrane receptor protein involved in Fe transport
MQAKATKATHLLLATAVGISGLAAHLLEPPAARAQSTTSGAIQGVVTDKATGAKLVGVTVTVTSPSLQGDQTTITEEDGSYKISPLPPGEYTVTFYYLAIRLERRGISVGVNRTTPVYQQLDESQAGGEVVRILDSAPTIDPTSTAQGITIDKNYMRNVPVPGRTFEAALGAAAGSQGDALGVSFSGSTSLENQYIVDGVNTTGLTFGTVGSPVINDFIEEIEVITGGYNAEFGRATGGIVNVVTKSGSNELKGSVFSTYRPGFLTAAAETTPINASSIDATTNNAYEFDVGFEVGGPIVKDRVWFYVGFVPRFEKVDVTRVTKRRTDCRSIGSDGKLSTCMPANGDGVPDTDPTTGFFLTENLDSEVRSDSVSAYNFLGKINFAASPEHQGQFSTSALPRARRADGIFGPKQNGVKVSSLVTDVALKWTSKFNDNKTEVEAVIGWHREKLTSGGLDPALDDEPLQVLTEGQLGVWGEGFDSESPQTLAGCREGGGGDPYPGIFNCPMDTRPYVIGGPGSITNDLEERRSARVSLTQRVKAMGNHEFKAGLDTDSNLSDKARVYSGGAFIQNFVRSDYVIVTRWVQLFGRQGSAAMDREPRFDNLCKTPNAEFDGTPESRTLTFVCDYLGGDLGSPGTQVTGNTLNWSAYLRDSWQIRPNLTLNLGLRYEEQRMRYSSGLQNQLDPLTELQLGRNAMVLTGNWAPRVGLLYDWTKEGRSKIYAHWGRFYESIPMDINDRSFGGETSYQQDYSNAAQRCGGGSDDDIGGPNGNDCIQEDLDGVANELIGASGVLVAPGIKSQYMDEIIGGFEYELLDDLKIGLSYQNRRLGRVIEDVSTDGAQTYLIANPGEFPEDEVGPIQAAIDVLEERLAAAEACLPMCDATQRGEITRLSTEKLRVERRLDMFKGIRNFDKPRRDYHALQLTVTRRFSKTFYLQGSYTYSRTQGNYPGLFSPDNGQVDPNISSQYDLIELLANRIGPLPYDRPHYVKIDGYYTFDAAAAAARRRGTPLGSVLNAVRGEWVVGARARAFSGIPVNALAGHYLYGANESFLLPRGQLGRTDFETGLDLHVGYARKLNQRMKLDFWIDLYNIYNRQGSAGIDDNYAPQVRLTGTAGSAMDPVQNANPVSGGTYEDLTFVKAINREGNETGLPIGKNPNFRNTNARYAPGYVLFGARLSF